MLDLNLSPLFIFCFLESSKDYFIKHAIMYVFFWWIPLVLWLISFIRFFLSLFLLKSLNILQDSLFCQNFSYPRRAVNRLSSSYLPIVSWHLSTQRKRLSSNAPQQSNAKRQQTKQSNYCYLVLRMNYRMDSLVSVMHLVRRFYTVNGKHSSCCYCLFLQVNGTVSSLKQNAVSQLGLNQDASWLLS